MIQDVKSSAATAVQKSSAEALKNNFKNLSSGLRVDTGIEPRVLPAPPARNGNGFTKLIKDLNDAVSFSSLALKSLERVADASNNGGDEVRVIEGFVDDLDKLRGDIGQALASLRRRAETAEVMRENRESADSRLQDVASAQAHAEQTGIRMHQDVNSAVSAHGETLTPDRVAELISE